MEFGRIKINWKLIKLVFPLCWARPADFYISILLDVTAVVQ